MASKFEQRTNTNKKPILIFIRSESSKCIIISLMEKDIISHTIPPAPKTVRGYLSSIDVNQHHILYFNAGTVVLLPQDPTKPVLNIVHLTDVTAAKFSPDGRFVASLEAKGTLIIN
jgi:hypothetical protein